MFVDWDTDPSYAYQKTTEPVVREWSIVVERIVRCSEGQLRQIWTIGTDGGEEIGLNWVFQKIQVRSV